MATISITIPDAKIAEIADIAKAEGLTTNKTNNQIVKEIIVNSLKAHYRSAKQRELTRTPIVDLDI